MKFKLVLDQAQLSVIVEHLNQGKYLSVAQLLSDIRGQVDAQMPQPKVSKAVKEMIAADKAAAIAASKVPNGKDNGAASRYAKAP